MQWIIRLKRTVFWSHIVLLKETFRIKIFPGVSLRCRLLQNDFREINQNGNWDIVYAKNYGSGFSDPQIIYATDNNETSPSIVIDNIIIFMN